MLMAASAFLFVGCKKHTTQVTPPQGISSTENILLAKLRVINANIKNGKTTARTTSQIDYTNSLNPYDSVGFYHNQCLDTLQAYLDITHDTTQSLTISINDSNYTYTSYIDKTLAVVSQYAYENNFYVGSPGNKAESFTTLFSNLSAIYNGTFTNEVGSISNLENLYEGSNNFDSVGLAFCNNWVNASCSQSPILDSTNLLLVQAIYSINVANSGDFNDGTVTSAINCVEQYEDSIISFNTANPGVYTSASYQQQLVMLSVMRYSVYYWYTIYNTPGSRWGHYYAGILYGTNNNNGFYKTTSWKAFWQGFCVNLADCGGGGMGTVLGAVAGGPAALITGPIGGAIVGSLASGAVSSFY